MEKGGISVSTENIFPVIKKWLYSDKDIFIREVVSNACDAITKYKRLVSLGETEEAENDYKVEVIINKDEKTITVRDNGIGMTSEEVKKYINQIALSGALEFIDKYESKDENSSGIIGHFGLGFYSIFMIADTVEMRTKSFLEEPAVLWTCDEAGSFSMKADTKASRGTEIIMNVSDNEVAYLDKVKLKEILAKYCSFMPYPVMFGEGEELEQINDTNPIWQKKPSDVTEEEYNELYKKVFNDFADPLMYIHINADYPLNFKGILYFPKIKNEYESLEPKINLYYNSVFVADNIKDIVPEYLLNVKGILDCPELPLNVSRSYLQSNSYVQRVSQHIIKKVADKINGLYTNEREQYEKLYDDLSTLIEYCCMRDKKFYERVKNSIIFKKTDKSYTTVNDYMDGKEEGEVLYTTGENTYDYYVNLYIQKGKSVLQLDKYIDTQFVQFLESENNKIKFKRIDSALDDLNEQTEQDSDNDEKIKEIFDKYTQKGIDNIKIISLGEQDAPALISVTEESRRMNEMMKAYGMKGDTMPAQEMLSINIANPIIKKLLNENDEKQSVMVKQIYMSAVMLSRKLTSEELNEFVDLNNRLLNLL
ncbi:molecular chaperone HtpG [Eubacteriales bacterium OttesenSCG-928-G02]|nr:molecular chaperone HtpG [Eubacteriales bacterium OttesenSCG-928-G02]